MPTFAYKALDKQGQIVKGRYEVQNRSELDMRLHRRGLEALAVREVNSQSLLDNIGNWNLGKVTRTELIEFSNNMAVMHQAGVPVVESLKEIKEDQENKYFKRILDSIIERIQGGDNISEAMKQFPKCFPMIYTNIIEIGERSGRLDTVFYELARSYKRIDDLIKNARKAMIYPTFVISVLIGVAAFFVVKVFPIITGFLVEFDIEELPPLTIGFMWLSNFVKAHWFLIVAGALFFLLLIYTLRKIKTTRYYFDWLELNLPYVKSFFLLLRMSFFSRYLAMLQSAGVDIIKSLDLSIPSTNNLVMEKLLKRSRERIMGGASLSATLRESRLIPNMPVRMIAIGEAAGTLPEQLDFVANHYDEILERKIAFYLAIVEPLLILVLAAMVLSLIGALFQPLYGIFTEIFSMY